MGDKRIGELHPKMTQQQLARKAANTGHPQGVSCDLTDALYVPGIHGSEFSDLAIMFGNNHVEVELALTTILDSLSLRSEQEVLRHVNGPRKSRQLLDDFHFKMNGVRVLDWIHPFKFTWEELRQQQELDFAAADSNNWFTAPNITWLRERPAIHWGHL